MNYSTYFETRTRDGKTFIACKDETPQEVKDLIRDIHFKCFNGCLPNNWIYQIIMEAFEELEDNDLDDITIESDPYYSQLNEWLTNPFAHEYCNQVIDEIPDMKDIYQIIGFGQYLAKRAIYDAVNDFMQSNKE
jgi:hypothetical protein